MNEVSIRKGDKGFTLIECIVVVGILLVLLVLSIGPGMSVLRRNVTSSGCASNLRQIGAAFYTFAAEHDGNFPAVAGDSAADSKDAQDGKGDQWDKQLTPYLDIPVNTAKTPLKKSVYYCPASEADPGYAGKPVVLLSYTYNVNIGKSESNPGVKMGTGENRSTVMLLADLQLASSTPEKSYVPQTGQGRNNTIVFRPSPTYYKFLADRHRSRMNILFLDGHVEGRMRLTDADTSSPPENVRWTPDGNLTGNR